MIVYFEWEKKDQYGGSRMNMAIVPLDEVRYATVYHSGLTIMILGREGSVDIARSVSEEGSSYGARSEELTASLLAMYYDVTRSYVEVDIVWRWSHETHLWVRALGRP